MLQRLLLEPLRAYLTKQFELASSDFERKEAARLAEALASSAQTHARRNFRLSDVARGATDSVYFGQVRALFESTNLWDVLPPSCCTVGFRALAFCGISRQACAFQELLGKAHAGFPHAIFGLLDSPDKATELSQVSECLVDPWSLAMKRKYGFESPTLHHILAAIATSQAVDISVLESKNATIRRLLTASPCKTHASELSYMSALWTLLQSRRSQVELSELGIGERRQGGERRAEPKSKPKKPIQKRRKGGTWNAFVRLATFGRSGVPDLRAIAAMYHAEKRARSDLYRAAVSLGKAGDGVQKLVPRWKSSFGLRTREVQRAALRQRRTRVYREVEQLEPAARSTALARHVVDSGAHLARGLCLARGARRNEAAGKRKRDEDMAISLKKFRDGIGAAKLQEVAASRPLVGRAPLVPEPCSIGVSARLLVAHEDVAKVLAWSVSNEKKSTLGANLDKFWADLHVMVKDEDDVCEGPTEPPTKKCWQLGVCVCAPGCVLQRRVNAVMSFIKAHCPANSKARAQLATGRLVLRLQSAPRPGAGVEEILASESEPQDLWLHIGYHTFSPYASTYMEVEPTEPLGEAPPDERRVYVRTKLAFLTMHNAISRLSRCPQLLGRLYVVEDSGRVISRWAPHTVPIVTMAGPHDWVPVWGGPRRRRAPGAGAGEPDAEGEDGAGEGFDEGEAPPAAEAAPEVVADAIGLGVAADLLLDAYELAPTSLPGGAAPMGPPPPAEELAAPPAPPTPDADEGVGDPPPLPPPLAPPAAMPERLRGGRKNPPRASLVLPNGQISYYESNGNFVAYCSRHDGCILTRKGRPPSEAAFARAPRRYRPLGFMTFWLEMAHLWGTKDEHWLPMNLEVSDEVAEGSRRELRDVPGAGELLGCERALPAEGVA